MPELLLMMNTTGILWRTAVSISMALNPKAQSPFRLTTGTSGRASFAPTAKGTPTPMQPLDAEFRRLAGV